MCDCGAETETTSYFFENERQKHRDAIFWIDASIKNLNEDSLIGVLLYDSDRFNDS